MSPATPVPVASGGLAISLAFAEPSSTFFNVWSSTVTTAFTVSQSGSGTSLTTTVTLLTSYLELPAVPLGAGQSPSASISITPTGNPPTQPTVDVSTILTNPMTGDIVQENGGSCQSTQVVVPPPPQ